MTPVHLNAASAHNITHSNETALATTEELKSRVRNRRYTNIEKTRKLLVQKQLKIVEGDYVQYWKDMQAAGFGSIIYGRKGNPDRFAWNYNLKDVASAGLASGDMADQPIPQIAPARAKKPGRPKGSKNRVQKAKLRNATLSKRTVELLISELTKTLQTLK